MGFKNTFCNKKRKNTKRHEGVECHKINPLLSKLVWSRLQDFGLVLILCFHGPRLLHQVHKNAKRELG